MRFCLTSTRTLLYMRHRKFFLFLLVLSLFAASCTTQSTGGNSDQNDSLEIDTAAMARLQGIWLDAETESPAMLVRGDSVYFPDTVIVPARFCVQRDSLILYGDDSQKYKIEKLGTYNLALLTTTGESLNFRLSQEPADSMHFVRRKAQPIFYTEVTKRDTVVHLNGVKYHCYVAINPTTKKVYLDRLTDEGLSVDNFYYDNVIHVSVYQGTKALFSHNIEKNMFSSIIPPHYLEQATLSDIRFSHIDAQGCRFDATVCIPDGALCYMVEVTISLDGQVSYKLMDY